jgi:hypothetical protein
VHPSVGPSASSASSAPSATTRSDELVRRDPTTGAALARAQMDVWGGAVIASPVGAWVTGFDRRGGIVLQQADGETAEPVGDPVVVHRDALRFLPGLPTGPFPVRGLQAFGAVWLLDPGAGELIRVPIEALAGR